MLDILIANLLTPKTEPASEPKKPRPRGRHLPPDPARVRAKENGEYIYEGRPCPRCGGTKRYTSNWGCVACQRAYKPGRSHHKPKEPRA
jgi:hypothetical protein